MCGNIFSVLLYAKIPHTSVKKLVFLARLKIIAYICNDNLYMNT